MLGQRWRRNCWEAEEEIKGDIWKATKWGGIRIVELKAEEEGFLHRVTGTAGLTARLLLKRGTGGESQAVLGNVGVRTSTTAGNGGRTGKVEAEE